MEIFRVPRRRVRTRIVLDDGRTLDGDLYTAAAVTEGRPETVLEHLNDPAEEFLPLTPGKWCDLVVADVPRWERIAYFYGVNHVHRVVKRGRVVWLHEA